MPTPHPEYRNLHVYDHPLIRQKLTRARDIHATSSEFRRLLGEIAGLMTMQASRHFETRDIEIDTPLERAPGVQLARPVTLVPILRAGAGMIDGILTLIPEARVGHIGVFRDEQSLEPVVYYKKFPADIDLSHILLIDPMLATGGSAAYVTRELKSHGCTDIRMVCLVAAPEGVRRMLDEHPDVTIHAAGLDRELDRRGFIRPGLGDAGDRMFGTA